MGQVRYTTGDLALSFQFHPDSTEEAEVAEASDSRGNRMNMHKNARLTPRGRERIVRQVEMPEAVAEGAGVCSLTIRK
jgi:hypothetical protein